MKNLVVLTIFILFGTYAYSQNRYTYATVTGGQSMLLSEKAWGVEPLNHLNFNAGSGYWFGNFLTIEVGVSYFTRGAENFKWVWEGPDRNFFLAVPIKANLIFRNFYLGAGPTVNFYVARKYEDLYPSFNTTQKHDRIPTTSISYAAQTGYILPLTDRFSVRGGLFADYLPGQFTYRNLGAELGLMVNTYAIAKQTHGLYTFATITGGQSVLLSPDVNWEEPLNHLNFNAGAGCWLGEHVTVEAGLKYITRGAEKFPTTLGSSRGTDRNFFLAVPIKANLNFRNFYLGAGPAVNFYVARKYRLNTIQKHSSIPSTSLSFAAQTGYNFPLTELFSIRSGLWADYLPGDFRYRNFGAELGLVVNLN